MEIIRHWWSEFVAYIRSVLKPATLTSNELTGNEVGLLQNLPDAAPRPSHLSKETWEVILRFEELYTLLQEENREIQRKSIEKLRQSILALPTQLSVEFDTTDRKVFAAFDGMADIISRFGSVVSIPKNKIDQTYVKESIKKFGQEFWSLVSECKEAIYDARQRCQAQKKEAEKNVTVGAFGVAGLLGAALLGPIVAVVALPLAGYALRTSADNSLKASELAKKDKNLAALEVEIDELSKRKGTK